MPQPTVQYLADANTQQCALNIAIGSAYSVMKCIVLHRSWRLEKDNGFAEHIRLATGATHDTWVQLSSSRVGHGGALKGPRASADGRGGGPQWPKVALSGPDLSTLPSSQSLHLTVNL